MRECLLLCVALSLLGCGFDLYREPPDGSGGDGTVDQAPVADVRNDHGDDDGLSLDGAVPDQTVDQTSDQTVDQKVPDQTVDQTSDQTVDQTVDQKVPDQTVDQTSDQTVDKAVPDQTVDKAVPDQTVDKAVPDQKVPDQKVPDQTVDQTVPDQTVDKAVPDQAVPDQTVPDQAVPDQKVPDQALPPDQLVCPPGSILDEVMGSSTGWVQMAGSSAAQILATQIYVPLNQYASVLHSNAAGLVCVPPGKGLNIALGVACASGTVSVALYDVYCTASTCNMKTAAKACNFTCNATAEVSHSCTATAQEVGGRWIYAARVGRSANGGSTATFTHLTLAVP